MAIYRHGDSKSVEHSAWLNMRYRCLNPNCHAYPNYGGRGIKICRRWEKYENFLHDMGRKPVPEFSLDRIDNDGDYTPKNCRWADKLTQDNNRRKFVSAKTRARLFRAGRGRIVSDETKAKIAEAQKDRPLAPEHVDALRDAYRGERGEKRKRKMSRKMKGRIFSEETRAKMSAAAKNRIARDGNPNPHARVH